MKIQGFRGNCDSQASWGCAPALPNRIRMIFLEMRFPITSRRQKKFFDPTIFQKCWQGVGEQPTFAKQIIFCKLFFLLQLHTLKLSNSNKVES